MEANVPPAFVEYPLLYMGTVFSLLLAALLALEWLWRLAWAVFERPAPLKSPTTVVRLILALLLVGGLLRSGPDLWLLMRWPVLTPAERLGWEIFDSQLDSTVFIFFSVAWLAFRLGEPMISYQLEKQPLPVHLWPTWRQLLRPLKIGVGVFAIAFALTYLR